MRGNSSRVYIEVEVDGKGGIKVLRQIGKESDKTGKKGKKSFQGMGRSVGDFNRQLQGSQKLLLKWGGTLLGGYAIKRVAGDFLDVASSFEQMEVKLDALTKGHGPETLAAINKWALDMPVNTRKAVDTFAMMQAMGLDPTIAKMQTLVDVSSIFGEEAMPRVARAMGQMITLGKLSAEELNQMAEAGINARKYLTQAFGMTVTELQKSKISIDQIVNAIWQGLNADYAGAAQKAQHSWQGLWTTFISYTEEAERQVMAAGVFDELKNQMSGINDELSLWIKNNSALIAQKVPEYLSKTKTGLQKIWDLATYDPAILEWGIVGLAFGGKKWALIGGSMAHMASWAQNLGKAMGMASQGIVSYSEIAKANFKDLEDIIAKGEARMNKSKTFGIGPGTSGYDIYKSKSTTSKPIIIPKQHTQALKDYKALMTEVEKAQQEFQNALILGGGTAAIVEEQLRRGVGDNLQIVKDAAKDTSNYMIELSQRTAEAMEQNFSDLYFDIMTGQFRSLGDYATAVLRSIQRATADLLGQTTKEALFDKGGGSGLIDTGVNWVTSLFSGGSSYPGAGTYGVNPGDVNWHAQGGSFGPNEWIGVGEKGPEIIYTGNKSGQVIPSGGGNVSVQVNVINNGEPLEQSAPAQVRFDGSKYIADVHIDRMMNNRSYRQANRQAMR
jgi:tape measure domain-containing protein